MAEKPINNTACAGKELCFNDIEFEVVDRDGVPWLRGLQIASALGFADSRQAIQKIYDRNADEFTPDMTALIDLPDLRPQNGDAGQTRKVRIFSPRGCWLIGMFARTERAKAFRKWVLDVLEREASPAAARPVPGTNANAKFTTDQLVALLRQGKTQAQAAAALGVSESAVSKRLRQLDEAQILQAIRVTQVPAVIPAEPEPLAPHPAEDWLSCAKSYLLLAENNAMLLRDMDKTLDHLLLSGAGLSGPDRTITFAVQDIVRRCAHYLSEFGGSVEQVRDATLAAITKAARGPRLLDPRELAERKANAQKAAKARWDKERQKKAAPAPVKARKACPDAKGAPA